LTEQNGRDSLVMAIEATALADEAGDVPERQTASKLAA